MTSYKSLNSMTRLAIILTCKVFKLNLLCVALQLCLAPIRQSFKDELHPPTKVGVISRACVSVNVQAFSLVQAE